MELKVNSKRLPPIINRHPWVFSGALVSIPEGLSSGQPVDLIDEQENILPVIGGILGNALEKLEGDLIKYQVKANDVNNLGTIHKQAPLDFSNAKQELVQEINQDKSSLYNTLQKQLKEAYQMTIVHNNRNFTNL